MPKLFLTSSPCDDLVPEGSGLPCIWDNANGLTDQLRRYVRPGDRGVIIAAMPDWASVNDEMRETFEKMFAQAGMPLSAFPMIDGRTADRLDDALNGASVVILGGGHVPTQLRFFEALGLRERLRGFDGVVLGISAGSMSSADTVYVQPEEPGETAPSFERFRRGLGLTDINILPHYNRVKDKLLDGRRLIDDWSREESAGHRFYVIPDGSHVLQLNGRAVLYGEGWLLADGVMTRINENGEALELNA